MWNVHLSWPLETVYRGFQSFVHIIHVFKTPDFQLDSGENLQLFPFKTLIIIFQSQKDFSYNTPTFDFESGRG